MKHSSPWAFISSVNKPLAALLSLFVCVPAMATVYELPEGAGGLFGREERVLTRREDTLYEIARRFSLGSEEIVRVNRDIDPWLPGDGKDVSYPVNAYCPPLRVKVSWSTCPSTGCTTTPKRPRAKSPW
jgi:L,D-transpeptidase ErfK/SrfK